LNVRAPAQRLLLALVLRAAAALALVMPMPAAAQTLQERAEILSPHFEIVRPLSHAPVPTVIMLHGCGGRRPFLDDYVKVARNAGAATIIVDSYAPRGISQLGAYASVCTGLRLHGAERAGDLYAAMHWARAQAWVDPHRLILAGWSHGAWTINDALALRSGAEMMRRTHISDLATEPLAGAAAAFLVYPYAGRASFAGRRDWRIPITAHVILAGRDAIVGVRAPRAAFQRQLASGAPLTIHEFPSATHAFEDAEARDIRVRYDAAATHQALQIFTALIADVAKRN